MSNVNSPQIPDRIELANLKLSPDSARWPRVRVTNNKGRQKWKEIPDIKDTDIIDLSKKGIPYTMEGKPGRKRKVAVQGTTPLVRELIKLKDAAIRRDPIVVLAAGNPDSSQVLHAVISALAEESAALRFERREAERNGESSGGVSERRVRALRTLGDTWLKRKELMSGSYIDLDSPGFHAVLALLIETVVHSMEHYALDEELIDSIIQHVGKDLSDESWRQDAKARMKSAD